MSRSCYTRSFQNSAYLLMGLFLLFYLSCNTDTQNQSSQKDKTALLQAAMELDSLFLVAFNSGDAEALLSLYWNSSDLVTFPPGDMQVKGFENVKASFVKDFESMKGGILEYKDAHNIVLADGVVGYGTFKWTMPIEGGEPMIMEGRYTELKAMKDGKMVILLDHTSVPMMPQVMDSTQIK